jgi:cardiolipin synthase
VGALSNEANEAISARGYQFLGTVDEAFEAMLAAVEAASSSIRLEVYIFRVSPIGETVREALLRARQRGVRVQVLVDALGSITLPERFWDSLIAAGGQFRWFNPIKFKRLGFRDHRKVLILDERSAFIGGFNVAPEYQGDGITKGWHDVGLRVPEPVARELAASFDLMFGLADYRHRRLARYRRAVLARISQTEAGQLLTNAPGRGPHVIKSALLRDIHASASIDIISGYFLPPRQLRRGMILAARRGRRVRLILAGKSDVRLSQFASRHLYASLLRGSVQIFEYQPQILHTKLFLFDDVVYAGSANMDKRSLLVNYELLVRVQDPELASQTRAFFERTLEHCIRIDRAQWRASRGLWSRFREQWAYFVLSKLDPYLTQLQLKVLHRESIQQKMLSEENSPNLPVSAKSPRTRNAE